MATKNNFVVNSISSSQKQSLLAENLYDVKGKVVVVTGGSRGIGLMIAAGFVVNGAHVYIISRSKDVCAAAAEKLNNSGPGTCKAIAANLSSSEACAQVAAQIKQQAGKIHVLVNNAGANWGAPIREYPDHAWDKVFNLNVRSVFRFTVCCLPLLEAAASKSHPASVINIGSINGFNIPSLETYAYSASKAAVHHLTHVMASKLSENNITVNALACGPFPSKMMSSTLDKFRDSIEAGVPLGRIGGPEDVVGPCLFLASRAGAFLTGTVIPVDGGSLVRASL